MSKEIQDFLTKHVGTCKICGHKLKQLARFHVSKEYPSGLDFIPTHWSILEVDSPEPTGVGCTDCEKGPGSKVNRNHKPHMGYYCTHNNDGIV